jgi:hypothetical protein
MKQCNGQILDLSTHKNHCRVVTTQRAFRSTRVDAKDNIPRKKILSITNIFKRYKITNLTRSIELSIMTNKVATRNLVEYGSGKDYVLLVATWQNTLYSATLFSLKEERNASKIGVSGTARQHGAR